MLFVFQYEELITVGTGSLIYPPVWPPLEHHTVQPWGISPHGIIVLREDVLQWIWFLKSFKILNSAWPCTHI